MLKSHISRIAGFMHSNRNGWLAAASLAILAALASTLASVGANDAFRPQPKRPQTPATKTPAQANKTYTLYTGLWRTDGSFVSTIRIKNVLVVAPMDVTPVIFMADGTPYMLSPVHIPVSGVATVNINDALAAAPPSIASHNSQYGSAALLYSYSSPGHVTASVAAIDAPRSLSYTYPFVEPMNMPGHDSRQVLEGLWWKRDQAVTGFVTLTNTTDQQRTAVLTSIRPGNNSSQQQFSLSPHTAQMFDLREFGGDIRGHDNRAGGIRVEYEGSQGAILVTGGLVNESEGYSADLPFWFHDMSSSSPSQITYASAGLMLGKPDPMMMPGFPSETTFSIYLSLRNATERPLDVPLQLNYTPEMGMGGAVPVTRNLPTEHLAPFEAKQVDLQGPLNAAGLKSFNGSINLSTSFTGHAGDLIIATGSVDQTGTYVFEVGPKAISTATSQFSNYWSVANGNDTMYSLWNPTPSAQDILVTFYYGDGSGKYTVPVHLEAQASTMIDMAMLIAEIRPDANGNIIPPSVQEGSASFFSAEGKNEKITLVIAAGIYNISTATCGSDCPYCCGDSNFAISPNPILCPIGESMPCTATATDCYGGTLYPGVTSWSSSNTSVMTVNVYGNVTGVSVGQATITANFDSVPTYTGMVCYYPCPTGSPSVSAGANATTPSQHTYPNPPLTGCRVSVPYDAVINTTTGKRHQAQDTVGTNIQVGTPVYAPEAGTITNFVTGQPHDSRPTSQCAGQNSPADFIELRSDSDQALTRLYHVTILPTLATIGTHVTGGQQIGTIDISGCTSAPHTHIQRKVNGVLVNFTMPCDNSHFDDPSTYYDDSDGTWP